MKRISLLLCFLLLVPNVTLVATPAPSPQTSQTPLHETAQGQRVKTEVQKRGIGEKARVRVTLHDKSRQMGYISRFEDTSFSITDNKTGRVNNISYSDVDRISGASR